MERFWIFFDIFSGMAKTRKIARRLHESIKIECSGGRKWHQNLKKWLRKPVQKRMRKMMPKLTEFGGQMEPKCTQKGIQKSMFFWLGFWKPLETLMGLRGGCEGGCGCHTFSSRPPGRRHIIKDYCTIISKHGWLAGSNTPRAVGPANFAHIA